MIWTDDDQQRIDSYAEQVLQAVRDSGLDLAPFVFGQLQAVGLLMTQDIQQRPERLKVYLLAIAHLADHVAPACIPDVEARH